MVSIVCPLIFKSSAETWPVGSGMLHSQETELTVARISVEVDVLLSENDSAIRDEQGVEVSIDAQDHEGALCGIALVPLASHLSHVRTYWYTS